MHEMIQSVALLVLAFATLLNTIALAFHLWAHRDA